MYGAFFSPKEALVARKEASFCWQCWKCCDISLTFWVLDHPNTISSYDS